MGNYNEEFRKKIVKLHLENGRSIQSLSDEFNISKSGISNWVKKYREECQTNTETKAEYDLMAENLRLRKKLEEAQKENLFLKKSGGILREGNRLAVYRFIEANKEDFGLRWLFRRCNIYPNGYYNYLKHRKQVYQERKDKVYAKIAEIYHENDGVPGYRMIKNLLERKNIFISNLTAHKYMNNDLGLFSIVRRKKPGYKKGAVNEVFPNLLQQKFTVEKPNKIWCTDFTYLPLTDGSMRYNCTIIDLFDRSVVASVTGKNITSQLAAETLGTALNSQPRLAVKGIILHSDQGSQFTSKEFTEFCKANGVTQSMSRAGCPYDNAPMERYFNTLKNELIYHHYYHSEEQLYMAVSDFAFIWYNHIRPHTFNKGKTPFQKRCSA